MTETAKFEPCTLFIGLSGAGLPEVDGLYVPSEAPPTRSESGVVSSPDPKVRIFYVDSRKPCPNRMRCELAEIQLGWKHLSTGDLLRAEQEAGV